MTLPCTLDPLGSGAKWKPDTVVYRGENGAAPKTLHLQSGLYYIEAIGGGGAASYSVTLVTMGSGGGSGAVIRGIYRLSAGEYIAQSGIRGDDSNMTTVPQGTVMPSGGEAGLRRASNNEVIVVAYGGGGATRSSPGGAGGLSLTSNYQVGELDTRINGNPGANGTGWTAGKGGDSVWETYGKGATGNAVGSGTHGIVTIRYIGAY